MLSPWVCIWLLHCVVTMSLYPPNASCCHYELVLLTRCCRLMRPPRAALDSGSELVPGISNASSQTLNPNSRQVFTPVTLILLRDLFHLNQPRGSIKMGFFYKCFLISLFYIIIVAYIINILHYSHFWARQFKPNLADSEAFLKRGPWCTLLTWATFLAIKKLELSFDYTCRLV